MLSSEHGRNMVTHRQSLAEINTWSIVYIDCHNTFTSSTFDPSRPLFDNESPLPAVVVEETSIHPTHLALP